MADLGVRPASATDVDEISRIQLETWRTAYAEVLPPAVLDGFQREAVQNAWRIAITAPPSDRHHVLVAHDHESLVGFIASAPAAPDEHVAPSTVEVTAMLVEPRWGRRGHGSRLLAAATDLARLHGFDTGILWVLEADAATRSFLASAGWAMDGMTRDLDMAGTSVRERRWHTDLRDG
jgi:GNAT superfamily N-acetyltransferase